MPDGIKFRHQITLPVIERTPVDLPQEFFYVRGTCLLKQTASGAQSVTSPSKIEGFREFEADLSALFNQ